MGVGRRSRGGRSVRWVLAAPIVALLLTTTAGAQTDTVGPGARQVLQAIALVDTSGAASLPIVNAGLPPAEPLQILGSSVVVFDSSANTVACPFLSGPDQPWVATERCSESSAFYDVSVRTVVVAAELSHNPVDYPSFAEFAVGYTLAGFPVNPEVPGFDAPTTGLSHISALNNAAGGLEALHSQATGNILANEFAAAHHGGTLTIDNPDGTARHFGWFMLENPGVPFRIFATSATDPTDPTTYGVSTVEVDPRGLDALPTPDSDSTEAVIAELTAVSDPPAGAGSDSPPADNASAQTDEPATTEDPPVRTTDPNNDGIPLIPIGIGAVALATGTGVVLTRRRPRGVPTNSIASNPYGPTPPLTKAQRFRLGYATRGEITPEMNAWGLAADLALSRRFGSNISGQWIFRLTDPIVIDIDDPIPEGALDHGLDEWGDGRLITFPFATRKYRINETAEFLGIFAADEHTAASILFVSFYQDAGTWDLPVVYANVWDRQTRRLFTSTSSRTTTKMPETIDEAMQAAIGGLEKKSIVAPWTNDPSDPLHRTNRFFARTLFIPIAEPAGVAEAVEEISGAIEAGTLPDWPADGPAPRPPTVKSGDAIWPAVHGSLAEEYVHTARADVFVFPHDGWLEMQLRSLVAEILARGATPDSDGWLPITSGDRYRSHTTHVLAPNVPADPDQFTGRIINMHTLRRLDRETCDAYDDLESLHVYEAAMDRLGLNEPEMDWPGRVYDSIELNDTTLSGDEEEVVVL